MATNTIKLHRVLRASPDRIYKAWTTAAAFNKWLPPNGYLGEVHEMDARVGGKYRMSFTDLGTGFTHSFGGEYLELHPGEKIRYTAVFDDPNLPGQMTSTITLRAVSCGTEVDIVQEGVPAVIPAEQCYVGWQQSLALLALLVEQ
ncbi:SRPBCC family protein [Pseudoduganella sp. OTU4001]|uniref:SRPBCC family protein n=1 Tax=Pseudoduganella sp. OTU4001 TaxID=3043854 RepID=UPI00313EEFD0